MFSVSSVFFPVLWPRLQDVTPRRSNLDRLAEQVLLGFAGLCFVVLTRYHWQQICDDAFITFRYANHVAAGVGAVWNRHRAKQFSCLVAFWLSAGNYMNGKMH